MHVAFYSAKAFEKPVFDESNRAGRHRFRYLEAGLTEATAALARGCEAACLFVNDSGNRAAIQALHEAGVRHLALRSAGFNHVDLSACERLGVTVARVPAYSPHAVAEHAAGLVLTLNRKLHRAANRTREHDFSLDGLMGFDLWGKTVGLIGAGRIGLVFARIMKGFGCRVLVCDPAAGASVRRVGATPVSLDTLLKESDVISLHCPLTPATRHLIDAKAFARMKAGVMLINTSRGGVVDTRALIGALKSGKVGSVGLDVYEEEGDLFFRDLSDQVLHDDVLARLLTFPNVVVTAHQAFFTKEAMGNIADTTIANLDGFASGRVPKANLVTTAGHVASVGKRVRTADGPPTSRSAHPVRAKSQTTKRRSV